MVVTDHGFALDSKSFAILCFVLEVNNRRETFFVITFEPAFLWVFFF